MVVAVIVTYNRKIELCKNLEMIYKQTIILDRVIVIDNCSTDGTKQYLTEHGYFAIPNFEYIKTEANIGGAGGFYTGINQAFNEGADFIILMDDDGRPCDNKTFEILIHYAEKQSALNVADGKLLINSLVVCGEKLTSKIGQLTTISEAKVAATNGIIEGAAHPFNGTLISRKLVEAIGYPNKDYFIKGDEVDYKQRTFDANGYVATLVDSRYYHPYVPTMEKRIMGKLVPVCVEAPWKEYYTARNLTYTYKKKKHYKMILFELVFVKLYAILTMKCPKWETIKYMFKGLRDGWKGHLGPTIQPGKGKK